MNQPDNKTAAAESRTLLEDLTDCPKNRPMLKWIILFNAFYDIEQRRDAAAGRTGT